MLSAALGRVYEEAGWDLALGEPSGFPLGEHEPSYPTLTSLQRAAERVVAEIGYSQRVTDDVLGFIRVRLASLRHGTTGRFLEGGHPLDFGALLRGNVVLEIEDVGDDADKAFLMGTVLIRLAEYLRLTHRAAARVPGLAHLTVVEEAHRLLRRPEPGGTGGAGAAGARGRAVRRPARGDPRLRRGAGDRRADPGPPSARRRSRTRRLRSPTGSLRPTTGRRSARR